MFVNVSFGLLNGSGGSINNTDTHSELICEFTDWHKCQTLRLLNSWSAVASVIISFITLAVVFALRKYRNFPQRILVYLLVSVFISSVGIVMNTREDGPSCLIQAFICQLSWFCGFLWVCVLTIYLSLLVIWKKSNSLERHERTVFGICWIISLLLAALPFTTNDYGPAGTFCWIGGSDTGTIWRFALWYGPVAIGNVLIVISFIMIYVRLYKEFRFSTVNQFNNGMLDRELRIREALKPFTGYAATQVILTLLAFSDRLYNVISDGEQSYPLKILQRMSHSMMSYNFCLIFYISHGRKEFSPTKFYSNYLRHKYSVTRCIRRAFNRSDAESVAETAMKVREGGTTAANTNCAYAAEDPKQAMDCSTSVRHVSSESNSNWVQPASTNPSTSSSYLESINK